jgi:hypothetical protein
LASSHLIAVKGVLFSHLTAVKDVPSSHLIAVKGLGLLPPDSSEGRALFLLEADLFERHHLVG